MLRKITWYLSMQIATRENIETFTLTNLLMKVWSVGMKYYTLIIKERYSTYISMFSFIKYRHFVASIAFKDIIFQMSSLLIINWPFHSLLSFKRGQSTITFNFRKPLINWMLSDQEIQKYILHTGTTWKTANKKKKSALGTCPTKDNSHFFRKLMQFWRYEDIK